MNGTTRPERNAGRSRFNYGSWNIERIEQRAHDPVTAGEDEYVDDPADSARTLGTVEQLSRNRSLDR